MYARGGRVAVAAGAVALTLLAGPGAWAAQGETGAGAGAGAEAGSGAGSGVGEVPGTVPAPVPVPDGGTAPAPGTEPGSGTKPEPGTKPAPEPGTKPEPVPGTKPAPDPGTKPEPAPGTKPAPEPLDVEARLYPDADIIAPGRSLGVRAIAGIESGSVPKAGLTLTLPPGVTYVKNIDDATNGTCKPAADGRSLSCMPNGGVGAVSAYVELKVGADVAPGTVLTFTNTVDIGDAVDSKPENNVKSAKVTVRTTADLGVEWTTVPKGPVKVGQEVLTEVTVTNHGPGAAPLDAVSFWMGFDNWPVKSPGYPPCWADPGVLICDVFRELAPGETLKYAFTWKFPKKAAGTTYKVPASLYSGSPLDPNKANDSDELVFKIAKSGKPKPPGTPKPGGTPTPTPTPSTSPSSAPSPAGGSGQLAQTGSGVPVAGLTAGAGALVLVGGALVVRRRRSS
ncbi:LPXTG cell wall anchor domain-containing protein [Streptomyces sp. ST1020]|uniref:LPXTG cell wall anchor domain-containing protein n=1 Tax=Streptomyces sp. ST1020 TaxID=1848901 RepID=UPI0034C6BA9B